MGICASETYQKRDKKIPGKLQLNELKVKSQKPSPASTSKQLSDEADEVRQKNKVILIQNTSKQSKYSNEPALEFLRVLSKKYSNEKPNIRPTQSVYVTESDAKKIADRVSKRATMRNYDMQGTGSLMGSEEASCFKVNNYFEDSGKRTAKVGNPYENQSEFRYSNVNYLQFQNELSCSIRKRAKNQAQGNQANTRKIANESQDGYQIILESPTIPLKIHDNNLNNTKHPIDYIEKTNNLYKSNAVSRQNVESTDPGLIWKTVAFEA